MNKIIKISFILILLFTTMHVTAQNVTENEKFKNFIQIWGLLKYHNPKIAKGDYDYNKEFIEEFNKLQNISDRKKINQELFDWISKFESGKEKIKRKKDFINKKNIFKLNNDVNWITNSGFDEKLESKLKQIEFNLVKKQFYATINSITKDVSFENDKKLENFDVNNIAHRYLFLASFWNQMKYWNVNIHLTEIKWSKVLKLSIIDFKKEGKENFEKAKEIIISYLNDSHSDYKFSKTLKSLKYFPSFGGRIVNDSLVITKIHNEEIFRKDSLNIGDVIYKVNNIEFKNYYENKFSKVISASNDNYLRSFQDILFHLASKEDSIYVEIFKKNGHISKKYIQLKSYKEIYKNRKKKTTSKNWFEIEKGIGYLNLEKISKKELKNAFKQFEKTNGIIIDLRNYPKQIMPKDIAKYIYPKKKVYVKYLAPMYPSYGKYESNWKFNFIIDNSAAGKNNKNYYKGKIVLIVDRKTGSLAEFIGMEIQCAPNCITIGEQTFGAVMNRNQIDLIDGTYVDFTGMGAYYPDNVGVQRKGLKIDVKISEQAKNNNSNLYIEKAIEIIKKDN
ncbi:S41 family peptidase [Aureivirga sp. CE67]|uniref:S41 family peptidase n=1 Tax=Aureivirga sp. CE67 TaxID=1788983 RepID=UPI0018CB4140|nr:S41 family peptidase [Aureivirga sp. CE67]